MDQQTYALAETIWDYHLMKHQVAKADAILVLCSHDERVAERAVELFREGWAPLIIFSTFVGYVAGGLTGALVMTLGIVIPAFCFPIFLHRQLVAVAENARLHPFLLGVAAGVIGLIAAVTVDIVDTSVVDVWTAVLAISAFVVLNRWHGKMTVLYVVLGCGLLGAFLQAVGLA